MNKANEQVVTAQGERTQNPTQQSVIDSFKAAQIHYSAKHLFIAHRVEERTNEEKVFAYDSQTRAAQFLVFREDAKAEWVVAEAEHRNFWEAMSRSKQHDNHKYRMPSLK